MIKIYNKETNTLVFDDNFNQILTKYHVPNTVERLIFDTYSQFNKPLNIDSIPKSVKYLKFGYFFDQPIKKDLIPNSVEELIFGHSFDQVLQKDSIPISVKCLTFGVWFNKPIEKGSIPDFVEELTFGAFFNQILQKDSLPKSIKHLTIDSFYNQQIISPYSIPHTLTHLTLTGSLSKIINNLPNSIKVIKLWSNTIDITNLPFGLEKLIIQHYNQHNKIKVPLYCIVCDDFDNPILI